MPDMWGRPTFDDGAKIAQGLMTIQNFENQQQNRQTEQDAYTVAESLAAGEDVSMFSDEARYKGAKLKFDQELKGLDKQIKEFQLSNEGRNQKMLELQDIDARSKRLFNQYQAARRSGNEDMARTIAHKFNNEVAYNGIHIPQSKLNKGKLSIVRAATGQTEEISDLPIEQYDQMISGYMNVPQEEMMQRMLSGEQLRMQNNLKIISQAEPLINNKGDIIYKVPAGTWDKKDSSVRGAFYIKDPTSQEEISPKKAKGYRPMDVAKGQAEIDSKKASAASSRSAAAQNTIVDPKKIVSGKADGMPQQGLVVQGRQGPEFQQVKGMPEPSEGLADPSKAKSAYDLQVKQLNTVLMPFNKTEAPIFEKGPDGNYQLAEGGHNALNAAWKLTQRDPASLSPQERQLAPHANQAVQMYQQLTQQNAEAYGLEQAPQKQDSGKVRMVYDRSAGKFIPQ